MKTFPISITLGLAIGLVTLLCSCSGEANGPGSANNELTSLSNLLASAKATLSERESTIQTLETKAKLHLADLAVATNRAASLTKELAGASAATDRLQKELQTRDVLLGAAQEENARRKEEAARLADAIQSLEHRLALAEGQFDRTRRQLTQLNQRANEAESEKAVLIQRWNDPSAVRAQVKELNQPSAPSPGDRSATQADPVLSPKLAEQRGTRASAPKTRTVSRLELQPDGSVKLVPLRD